MSDVARLFPVDCPVCERPTSADGIAHMSVVLANLKSGIRTALDLHYLGEDDENACGYCHELWPCETIEVLGSLLNRGRS